MSKDSILLNVKNALKQNKLSGAKKDYKDLIKHLSNNIKGDILEEYKINQSNNKAIIVESSNANVTNSIKDILKTLKAKKILYSLDMLDLGIDFSSLDEFDIKPYDKSVDVARKEIFNADTSIVYARCGIADLGIFGVVSSPKHPRLASLVTTNCIVILKRENILESFPDGLKLLCDGERFPSNMVFIAGASRTADIELKTVFGVHGPQQVYIILV